jgi:hypothetical protein
MSVGTCPCLIGLTLVAVLASVSQAHHSVTGQFDPEKPLVLTGVISKVDWINPHVYVHLDVREDDGQVTSWSLETAPTAMLRRAGLTRASLQGPEGETVTIQAIPARDETKKLGFIYTITYADGTTMRLSQDRR